MAFPPLSGNELVSVTGITPNGFPSGTNELTSAQSIANLAGYSFLNIISVKAFGAKGDGVTDDTAAIQSALNSITIGGWLLFSAGTYLTSATLQVNTKCTIIGQGGSESQGNAVSRVITASATLDCFLVNVSGVAFQDIMIQNVLGLNGAYMSTVGTNRIYNTTQVPTAGCGIHYIVITNQYNPQPGDYVHLDRVTVQGFYNNIQFDSGFYYTITACNSYDPVNFGIYLNNLSLDGNDHGDQTVTACNISMVQSQRTPVAAVKWESGGGLRFVNNKINGTEQPTFPPSYNGQHNASGGTIAGGGTFQYGIFAEIGANANDSTSVLVIVGNSIENCTAQSIFAVQGLSNAGGTSAFGKVVISGNEMGIGAQGITVGVMGTSNTTMWQNVVITGNDIANVGAGISLYNIWGGIVANNIFQNVGIPASSGVNTAINLVGFIGCYDIITGPNLYYGDNATAFGFANAGQPLTGNRAGLGLSQAKYNYQRELPLYTAGTAQSLYHFVVPAFQSGILEFTLCGNLSTIGASVSTAKFYYTRGASGAVTATQIGATGGPDTTTVTTTTSPTGTNYTIFVDTTTTAGEIRLSFVTSLAAFTGVFDITVTGIISAFRKGN